MNIFKMETKNSQLAHAGVVGYVCLLVLMLIGVLLINLFNIIDVAVMLLFLYSARKAAKKDGNIIVGGSLYIVYWLISLLVGAFGSFILLPLAAVGIIDMALHPDHAPAFLKWILR